MNERVLPPSKPPSAWPDDLTRVPYSVFQDQQIYAEEQRRIFQGPNWHYLALEVELAAPGDFLVGAVDVLAEGREQHENSSTGLG